MSFYLWTCEEEMRKNKRKRKRIELFLLYCSWYFFRDIWDLPKEINIMVRYCKFYHVDCKLLWSNVIFDVCEKEEKKKKLFTSLLRGWKKAFLEFLRFRLGIQDVRADARLEIKLLFYFLFIVKRKKGNSLLNELKKHKML